MAGGDWTRRFGRRSRRLVLVAAAVLAMLLPTFVPSSPAEAIETVLSTGTADANGVQGAKWRRVDFTVPASGSTTLRLSWTGTADMRLAVYNSSTGAQLGRNISSANPKSVTLNLQTGVAYHAGVWAVSGVGQYQFVMIDSAPTTTTTSSTTTTTTQPPAGRPNVVLINLDDARADSILDMPKTRQWLADGGTTFRNAYVSTPSCCPSRATLMSGRYVHNNGQFQQQNLGFDMNLTTQRYLRDAGYFTGHAGKFLHWLALADRAPHWDRWLYFRGGYEDVWMNFDGTSRRSSGYSTTITFDQSIAFINDFEQRNDGRPFYLSVAPIAPHLPSIAEAQYASAPVSAFQTDPSYQEADRSDKPSWVRNRTMTAQQALATRTAMIRTLYTVDDQVDRLMLRLQALGELGNTMVIFTSDNGQMWGEHRLPEKFLPYRKSVEVPLLLRWPGRVAAGAVDDRFVTHIDISPTILAAAGVTQNLVAQDGRNILGGYNRSQAFMEYFNDPNNVASIPTWASLRTSTYQYTEYYNIDNPGVVVFREYYDMQTDPYQLVNLLADGNPSNDPNTAPIAQALQAQKACVGSSCS